MLMRFYHIQTLWAAGTAGRRLLLRGYKMFAKGDFEKYEESWGKEGA